MCSRAATYFQIGQGIAAPPRPSPGAPMPGLSCLFASIRGIVFCHLRLIELGAVCLVPCKLFALCDWVTWKTVRKMSANWILIWLQGVVTVPIRVTLPTICTRSAIAFRACFIGYSHFGA